MRLDFRKAIETDPSQSECYYNLGNAEFALKHFENAILMFTRAIAIDEDFAAAYFNRATVYKVTNMCQKAIEDLSRALEVTNPAPSEKDLVSYRVSRGEAYYTEDMLNEAIADVTVALNLDSSCVEAYALKAGALVGLGNFEAAIGDATTAVEIDPECASAYYHRGQAHHSRGEHEAGLKDLGQAIELCEEQCKAEYLHMRGVMREELGNLVGSSEDMYSALQMVPELLQLDLSAREGAVDPDEADAERRKNEVVIAHASEKVKEGQGGPDTYIERGCAYLIKLDHERALNDFSTQLDAGGKMGCTAHYWCGKVQQALDQNAEALEYFNRALKISGGEHAPVYVARGEVMMNLGKLHEAEGDAKKALDLENMRGEALALQVFCFQEERL